nr:type II toxin-antitoxin system RelE/ParE family toxin [Crenothrix polyspora]
MTWAVLQTRRFSRQYKKLHDNTAFAVDAAIDEVTQNPDIHENFYRDLKH